MAKTGNKILALILAFVVTFTYSAGLLPATGAFAATPEGIECNLVCIGDSTSSGYGLHDFKNENCGYYYDNRYLSESSYPKKLAKAIPDIDSEYSSVNLTALTLNGMRTNELRGMLDKEYYDAECEREHDNVDSVSGKGFFRDHMSSFQSALKDGEAGTDGSYSSTKEYFVNQIEKADVITIDVCNNNFGTYMAERLAGLINVPGKEYGGKYNNQKIDQLDMNQELAEKINALKAESFEMLKDMIGLDDDMKNLAESLVDTLMYCVADCIINLSADIELIREINPNARLIVVGTYNGYDGFKLTQGEKTILNLGDIAEKYLGLVNSYIKFFDKNNDNIYYADLSSGVSTIIDELCAGNITTTDNEYALDNMTDDFIKSFVVPEALKTLPMNDALAKMAEGVFGEGADMIALGKKVLDTVDSYFDDESTVGSFLDAETPNDYVKAWRAVWTAGGDTSNEQDYKDDKWNFGEGWNAVKQTFYYSAMEDVLKTQDENYYETLNNVEKIKEAIDDRASSLRTGVYLAVGTAASALEIEITDNDKKKLFEEYAETIKNTIRNLLATACAVDSFDVDKAAGILFDGGGISFASIGDEIAGLMSGESIEGISDNTMYLLHVLCRFMLVNGIGEHPSKVGCTQKYKAVLNAYTTTMTAKDMGVVEAEKALVAAIKYVESGNFAAAIEKLNNFAEKAAQDEDVQALVASYGQQIVGAIQAKAQDVVNNNQDLQKLIATVCCIAGLPDKVKTKLEAIQQAIDELDIENVAQAAAAVVDKAKNWIQTGVNTEEIKPALAALSTLVIYAAREKSYEDVAKELEKAILDAVDEDLVALYNDIQQAPETTAALENIKTKFAAVSAELAQIEGLINYLPPQLKPIAVAAMSGYKGEIEKVVGALIKYANENSNLFVEKVKDIQSDILNESDDFEADVQSLYGLIFGFTNAFENLPETYAEISEEAMQKMAVVVGTAIAELKDTIATNIDNLKVAIDANVAAAVEKLLDIAVEIYDYQTALSATVRANILQMMKDLNAKINEINVDTEITTAVKLAEKWIKSGVDKDEINEALAALTKIAAVVARDGEYEEVAAKLEQEILKTVDENLLALYNYIKDAPETAAAITKISGKFKELNGYLTAIAELRTYLPGELKAIAEQAASQYEAAVGLVIAELISYAQANGELINAKIQAIQQDILNKSSKFAGDVQDLYAIIGSFKDAIEGLPEAYKTITTGAMVALMDYIGPKVAELNTAICNNIESFKAAADEKIRAAINELLVIVNGIYEYQIDLSDRVKQQICEMKADLLAAIQSIEVGTEAAKAVALAEKWIKAGSIDEEDIDDALTVLTKLAAVAIKDKSYENVAEELEKAILNAVDRNLKDLYNCIMNSPQTQEAIGNIKAKFDEANANIEALQDLLTNKLPAELKRQAEMAYEHYQQKMTLIVGSFIKYAVQQGSIICNQITTIQKDLYNKSEAFAEDVAALIATVKEIAGVIENLPEIYAAVKAYAEQSINEFVAAQLTQLGLCLESKLEELTDLLNAYSEDASKAVIDLKEFAEKVQAFGESLPEELKTGIANLIEMLRQVIESIPQEKYDAAVEAAANAAEKFLKDQLTPENIAKAKELLNKLYKDPTFQNVASKLESAIKDYAKKQVKALVKQVNEKFVKPALTGVAVIGITAGTVATVIKVKEKVEASEKAKTEKELARLLAEAKTNANAALLEAVGDCTDDAVKALFDKGCEAVAAAATADDVMLATVEYVNRIGEVKTILGTKITQNKLKAYKNGKIKVSFVNPELAGTVDYQVVRSTKKDFSKSLKTYTVKAKDAKTLTMTNAKTLKKGTKYYYKVRANVQLAEGSVISTDWSNVKYATCKKTIK